MGASDLAEQFANNRPKVKVFVQIRAVSEKMLFRRASSPPCRQRAKLTPLISTTGVRAYSWVDRRRSRTSSPPRFGRCMSKIQRSSLGPFGSLSRLLRNSIAVAPSRRTWSFAGNVIFPERSAYEFGVRRIVLGKKNFENSFLHTNFTAPTKQEKTPFPATGLCGSLAAINLLCASALCSALTHILTGSTPSGQWKSGHLPGTAYSESRQRQPPLPIGD